jgi:hypothetical protein
MTSESQNVSEPIAATPVAGSGIDDASILSERSASTLMSGIIADVQRLIEQQLSMVRQEIRDDLRKSKQAASSLALGAGLTAGGNCLLLLMLPLLLNWLVPTLPLWTCFGIVGGVVSAAGGALLYVRFQQTESFDLLSNQAVEAFKENLKWTTKT